MITIRMQSCPSNVFIEKMTVFEIPSISLFHEFPRGIDLIPLGCFQKKLLINRRIQYIYLRHLLNKNVKPQNTIVFLL